MEIEKLYYLDSHLSEFDAVCLACAQAEGAWEVVLDRTAFYPLGGGQAADTGTLGEIHVLDTRERGEEIVHTCDGPIPVSSRVHGKIDYEARFLRMQQHTGEHIVSGILHRIYGCHNTGFHMNDTGIVIDFDAVIPAGKLPEIEAEANEALWKNIPLKIYTPTPEELEKIPYRTKKALPWPVRIVEIPGYDICACCGTHVAATGEVGLIKLLSAIPCRGGTRIEMAAGMAAFRLVNAVFDQNRQVSRLLSAQLTQTAQGAEQLLETMNAWKNRAGSLERQLFGVWAETLSGAGDCAFFTKDLTPDGLRLLTDLAAGKTGGIAAGFSETDGGLAYCLAQPGGDLRALNKEMNGALSGRGGGKPGFQQGKLTASAQAVRDFFAGKGFAVRELM